MEIPSLLSLRGSSKPHLFASGIVSQVDVPLKSSLTEVVPYIEVYLSTLYTFLNSGYGFLFGSKYLGFMAPG